MRAIHDVRENLPPYGGQQVERGAVLVATDYEGLGTPGVPTSTVAAAEGHAVLDSIRAVAELPNVGPLGNVMLAGHSQGGRAALVAAEIAPEYAPELHLVGALALAPGVELPALVDYLVAPPGTGIVLIGAIGLRAGYPELDLSTVFTPSAVADIPRVENECVDDTFARYQSLTTTDVIRRAPSDLPDLQALLEANSPGAVAPAVPIFLGHGDADQQVPVELSGRLKTSTAPLASQSLDASTPASATTTSSTPQARTPSPSSPTASTTNLRPRSVEDRFCAVAAGCLREGLCETPPERPG